MEKKNNTAVVMGTLPRVWVINGEKFGKFKVDALRLINIASHCEHVIEPNEIELAEILGDIKEETAEFVHFIEKVDSKGVWYDKISRIPERPSTPEGEHKFLRSLDREALFYALFESIKGAKNSMLNLGTSFQQERVLQPHQITEEQYMNKLIGFNMASERLQSYFAPTDEDCMGN